MPKHLQREVEAIKKKIITLGAIVEDSVRKAALSIEERDDKLAVAVIDGDENIDDMEVEIEEDCLKILALHQPVAIDLRFLIAVLKLNNDLERIGDLAVNIAERAVFLASQSRPNISFDFVKMADNAQLMLKKSLDALVNLSVETAVNVCGSDDIVDEMNREMYTKVQEGIRKYPEQMESMIHLLSVSRHLERIADHATNIAQDVIYMIDGQIVRHKTERYK